MRTWDEFSAAGSPRQSPPALPVRWREARREQQQRQNAHILHVEPRTAPSALQAWLGLTTDGLFAFALFVPLLFMVQLGTIGAAILAVLTPLYLFMRRQALTAALAPRAFLFVLPTVALLSVVWSEAPKETLKGALELGLTILAGLLLSSARNQESVLRGLALAFILYIAVALVQGGTVGVGVGSGGQAFAGLTNSKNLIADIAASGAIISSVVAIMGLSRRKWIWTVIGLLGVALAIQAIAGARSAGATLGLMMGVGAVGLLLPLLAAGKIVRAWLTSVVAVCLIAVGLNYRSLAQAMVDMGAQVFDKDPTLTGRTYLWYRAADLIAEKPWLGRGYQAFWQQGNTDAEGLWRYFGITGRSGFTFHNTGVEILVALGWVGLIVVAVTILTGVLALVRRFVVRPDLGLVCWVGLLLYQLARMPIESIGLAPFYFSTVLAFAALGAAFSRVHSRDAHRRQAPQGASVVQVWSAEDLRTGRPSRSPSRAQLRLLHGSKPPP